MKVATDILLKLASPADEAQIRNMLAQHELLVDDLSSPLEHFFVCKQKGVIVGLVGLEWHDNEVLLRSLLVTKPYRGQGLGKRLVWMALGHAAAAGATQVHLLTTDSVPFFAALGFQSVERNQSPIAIQSSSQFHEFCPKTATVMKKELSKK